MLSTKMRLLLVGTFLCFGLAGCASKDSDSGSYKTAGASSHDSAVASSTTTYGIGDEQNIAGQETWGRSKKELLADRTFHFNYDRFDVKNEDHEAILAHAEYLASHPNKTIRLEGHTDERGSREYNVALGERRSNSVRDVMLSHGVRPNQIHSVSYGEEKPMARGSDEDSYGKNRRAEIVYE